MTKQRTRVAALPCPPKIDKKTGKYCTTWTNHYPDDHPTQPGKPFTDYQGFDTKDLDRANQRYVDFLVLHTKGKVAAVDGHRTVHWCLDYYKAHHLKPGKVIDHQEGGGADRIIKMWRDFFPATKMVHEINKRLTDDPEEELDLDRWERLRRNDRQFPIDPNTKKPIMKKKDGTPKKNAPIKPSTIRRELCKLKTVLNYCVKKQALNSMDLPHIPMGREQKGRLGHINEDQFGTLAAILEKVNSPQRRGGYNGKLPGVAIYGWVMFMTGCRPNEAKWLEWDKVYLNGDTPEIDFTIDGRPETCKVRNPHAPIPDALLPILRRAKAERTSKWVCIKPVGFEASFTEACIKAGFPTTGPKKITPHSMRHSRITLAVASGMSEAQVSDLFRLDIKTVMETYFHGTAEQRAKNANKASDANKLMRAGIKVVK